jgi:peptidoglycan hydrolase CwlO-like protein
MPTISTPVQEQQQNATAEYFNIQKELQSILASLKNDQRRHHELMDQLNRSQHQVDDIKLQLSG